MEAKSRASAVLATAVGTERGASTAVTAAERFAVDDDAAAPTGEGEDGSRDRNIGKRPEADAQAPVRGCRGSAQGDPERAAVQVGEEIGQATGRFAEVDRALERSIEKRAPDPSAAQARSTGATLRRQSAGAERADMVDVE
jgi:hypothetical protein